VGAKTAAAFGEKSPERLAQRGDRTTSICKLPPWEIFRA
jgi:hypothetical protein